jgi:hypothetical protein
VTLDWRNLPYGSALKQPDQRSCGPSCAVVARMARDSAYARETVPRFDDEVLATHRRVTGLRGAAGALQIPWPRALGTPPWALADEMGGSGAAYRWRVARFDRAGAFQRVLAGVRSDQPVAVYVGSTLLPRHVVLALGEDAGDLDVYNPGSGRLTRVTAEAFAGARLGLGSWQVPWFTVEPRP